MRKLAIVAVAAAALSLSACNTLSPSTVSSLTTSFITAVEKTAATVCSAVPEVSAIITLVNSGIGQSVSGVASAFCAAFATATPAPVKAGRRAPPVMARRFGRRFGGGPTYECAGSICGWKL